MIIPLRRGNCERTQSATNRIDPVVLVDDSFLRVLYWHLFIGVDEEKSPTARALFSLCRNGKGQADCGPGEDGIGALPQFSDRPGLDRDRAHEGSRGRARRMDQDPVYEIRGCLQCKVLSLFGFFWPMFDSKLGGNIDNLVYCPPILNRTSAKIIPKSDESLHCRPFLRERSWAS